MPKGQAVKVRGMAAARYVGLSVQTLHKKVRQGKVRKNRDGSFNVAELQRFLAAGEAPPVEEFTPPEPPKAPPKAKKVQPKAKKRQPDPENNETGLENALARLRQAEVTLHERWLVSLDGNAPDCQKKFESWQSSLDLLRKSEQNLVKHLQDAGELMPTAKVRVWMTRMVEATKQALLNVPGKVSPALDGAAWPAIQKTLDKEIRSVLEKLSEDPK